MVSALHSSDSRKNAAKLYLSVVQKSSNYSVDIWDKDVLRLSIYLILLINIGSEAHEVDLYLSCLLLKYSFLVMWFLCREDPLMLQ